ncbi:MAG: hypothetical protein K2Q11_00750 [Burkholderiaceae bacterium]|nr:hypothetical protein [Burkholderiaceae bacterium]
MQAEVINYPWAKELEKTVVHSLTTSFGLDFLLFKDKLGGDVDTIHNVRSGIYATKQEQSIYIEKTKQKDKNGKLVSSYNREKVGIDKDENYINKGRIDAKLQDSGNLIDGYTGKILLPKKGIRDLDHIIAAKEIYDDAGRVLADLGTVELANNSSNLQSTHRSINRSKQALSVEDFSNELPKKIKDAELKLGKDQAFLATLPRDTPEQRQKASELESDIIGDKIKIDALKSVDHEAMLNKDKEARKIYDAQINQKYYSSSKFIKNTATASGAAGLKMGTRQMLGLILAEVWFELREQIPIVFEKLKTDFKFEHFIDGIQETLKGIWHRVKVRFNDFLISFKDGVFAGAFASLTTTLFNIFATTQRAAIKIIREMWGQIVNAIKLIALNPDDLSFVDLSKAVLSILSAGVSAVVGTMVYAELIPLCGFPFGGELAAFAGALVTGVCTLGLNYFLLHSGVAKKVWDFAASIMPHAGTVKKFQEINAELDRYLTELGKIEFNLDVDELADFSRTLAACNSEMERGLILKDQAKKRGIELPYEIGNSDSTRKWLASLI